MLDLKFISTPTLLRQRLDHDVSHSRVLYPASSRALPLRIRDAGPRNRNDKERILFVLALRQTSKEENGCDYVNERGSILP